MKIMTIVGARPQFVKAAVISRELAKRTNVTEIVIHTGQHYDDNMSEIFFEQMQIPKPTLNLGVGGMTHGAMTGEMLAKIETQILEHKPDLINIYGDTNSTLAGALAAVKLHVPISHVEAGLRSYNPRMPEEINRILADKISNWLFCPTQTAVANLEKEGIEKSLIHRVGDVMYDAALFYSKINTPSDDIKKLLNKFSKSGFILTTVHRGENTDTPSRLQNIFKALDQISSQTPVVLPLHPRTKKYLNHYKIQASNIHFIQPIGYFDMVALLKECTAVITDSGGLQKEAYFFGKACLTLRDETEWVELIENNVNKLAGADFDTIINLYSNFLTKPLTYNSPLYGNGDAGKKICDILMDS